MARLSAATPSVTTRVGSGVAPGSSDGVTDVFFDAFGRTTVRLAVIRTK